ncbi:hypothetical protein ACIBKX_33700 [Streptomyces sp. NPDC050658]|uniref:hypothetical protein n=1 Tax=Streptomyces sp. NPDC050658 TaxID=3365633 RepID=UPI00378DD70F
MTDRYRAMTALRGLLRSAVSIVCRTCLGWWFQQLPEPKVAKNQRHFDDKVGGRRDVPLDVRTQRVDATVEWLVKSGATGCG